jgi:hypothetical protein
MRNLLHSQNKQKKLFGDYAIATWLFGWLHWLCSRFLTDSHKRNTPSPGRDSDSGKKLARLKAPPPGGRSDMSPRMVATSVHGTGTPRFPHPGIELPTAWSFVGTVGNQLHSHCNHMHPNSRVATLQANVSSLGLQIVGNAALNVSFVHIYNLSISRPIIVALYYIMVCHAILPRSSLPAARS